MTTQQRIGEYLKAYGKHLKAQREQDAFSDYFDAPPKPEDFGLSGATKQIAVQHAEKLSVEKHI